MYSLEERGCKSNRKSREIYEVKADVVGNQVGDSEPNEEETFLPTKKFRQGVFRTSNMEAEETEDLRMQRQKMVSAEVRFVWLSAGKLQTIAAQRTIYSVPVSDGILRVQKSVLSARSTIPEQAIRIWRCTKEKLPRNCISKKELAHIIEGPHYQKPNPEETARRLQRNGKTESEYKTRILLLAERKESKEVESGFTDLAMFFFFVGGLQQEVRQVLKSGVGRCTYCRNTVDLVHSDKVLKLFFVPVWRWPAKDPLLYCAACNNFFPHNYSLPPAAASKSPPSTAAVPDALRCRFCDRAVEADFRFCPFCGSEI
ncbi:hypothetical protein VNO78_30888 [Psophocarpus tetragonolobus]|uniref:Zinc-ribbon 15 domain-containing protein n=1 Tax=Psophocarpus tetragonolobus TaxID=3891 RepID=A0AAN9RXN8_PSOTE